MHNTCIYIYSGGGYPEISVKGPSAETFSVIVTGVLEDGAPSGCSLSVMCLT